MDRFEIVVLVLLAVAVACLVAGAIAGLGGTETIGITIESCETGTKGC